VHVGLVPLRDLPDETLDRWRDLAHDAAEPNPFVAPEFVLPAAFHLEEGAGAALLHVDDGDGMVFALPVVRRRRYRKLPLRTLSTWRHPYCYLGTPLTRGLDATAAWLAVLGHLRRSSAADLLALELFPDVGAGMASLTPAAAQEGRSVSCFDTHRRPIIHRRPQADYFQVSMSSKRRKNLRRQRRHLDDLLEGRLRRIDWGPEHVARPAAVELFLGLEKSGWKGQAGTAIACSPADTAFFRSVVDQFAVAGQLQLWFLEASGPPVAAQCNLIAGDTVFHFKIAYEESLARYSPGVLLELEMIEEFHEDPQLNHIDSCAAPGSMYESLYPDSRWLTAALVPLRPSARAAAPALASALRRRSAKPAAAGPAEDAE
jgi:CelD/BcsL family acetyltransferase involved in cellulose biosynthesis